MNATVYEKITHKFLEREKNKKSASKLLKSQWRIAEWTSSTLCSRKTEMFFDFWKNSNNAGLWSVALPRGEKTYF